MPITVAKKYAHTSQPLHLHEFDVEQASPALTQTANDNGKVLVMMHLTDLARGCMTGIFMRLTG
jgi:hypothetical protein